ncbi:MAG TPA: ribosomal-protein-alanine N-acetyltransferase, partial [Burkholderiales bacterium]|nr:ribosomal-protein-alanine N-acetyltransferase [Burkholderiales bacterium]
MSAVLKELPELGRMREQELDEVMAIEDAIYTHPWTRGNFVDSLRAGYQCCVLKLGTELIGYFVLMVAAGEAHLLNLSI